MKKAELELQQQIEAANAEADLMDDDEQNEQEPPPQTQPTSAPTIDSGSSTERPIINQESGIADNPATNPVYPSSDPALPERSYKELDHTLQKIYRENTRNTVPSSATTTPQTRKSKTPLGMML